MKYIVAVSGGVDSVVLLDMLHAVGGNELIVAHFDHGIREDSHQDVAFVGDLAKKYGLKFETAREELGSSASEELARERRYAFLKAVAKKHQARIMTAHHLDDLVETVAINLTRGTGWRGLAALDAPLTRPLIDTPKKKLIEYALERKLQWREDSTNASDAYLRNRIRKKAVPLTEDDKRQLRALHAQQKLLRREIEAEAKKLVGEGPTYSRYFLTHLPYIVAMECLRVITKGALTRPQAARLLHAVKTARPGSRFEAKSGMTAQFTTRYFTL
jgi:tRNA(Ile)-lysidine synthase